MCVCVCVCLHADSMSWSHCSGEMIPRLTSCVAFQFASSKCVSDTIYGHLKWREYIILGIADITGLILAIADDITVI